MNKQLGMIPKVSFGVLKKLYHAYRNREISEKNRNSTQPLLKFSFVRLMYKCDFGYFSF